MSQITFWEIFNYHHPKLLARLLNRGFSLQDAEDALQDALVRAAEGHQILASNDIAWQSWLTTTAANLLTDQFRHEAAIRNIPLSHIESNASLSNASSLEDDFTSAVEFSLLFQEAWTKLGQNESQLLRLKQQGYSCEEIAAQMGMTITNVKKRLQRARTRLQEEVIAQGLDNLFTEKRILSRSKTSTSLE